MGGLGEEEQEEDRRVAWHREEGNVCGSPLGLWGHTKPEKLVLTSLEYGNFTCDGLWHTQRPGEEVFQMCKYFSNSKVFTGVAGQEERRVDINRSMATEIFLGIKGSLFFFY